MSNDINKFIIEEKEQLNNIVSGLTQEQKNIINGDIVFINYLLDLLKSSNLSKKDTNKLEKKITDNVDKLEDITKEEQKNHIGSYTLTKNIKPNIDSLPDEVIDKAKMVKASSIAYDTDFNQAQMFLDQNDIPYIIDEELSNSEGLVLHNPATKDTKLAFRGTKFTSAEDLYTDGLIATGYEDGTKQFSNAREQAQKALTKYGSKPSESLGYSKGGALAIDVADFAGIPESTTFNAFIGYSSIGNKPSATKHNLYRTTEDIPSILVGFKQNLDNYNVNTIRPHKDSLDVRKAHDLKNFLSNKKRAQKSTLEDLVKDLADKSAQHGEAIMIKSQKDFLNNKRQVQNKDLYNTQKKINSDSKHPFLSYNLEDEFYNQPSDTIQEQDIPFLQQQLETNYPSEFELNQDEIYARNFDEFGEHGVPMEFEFTPTLQAEPNVEALENRLKILGETEPRIRPVEVPLLVPEPSKTQPSKNFADWVHDFNSEKGTDTIVENGKVKLNSSRFHLKSRHVKAWRELGNDLTEEEKEHFKSFDPQEDDKFYLNESQRNKLYNADESGENKILDDLHKQVLQAHENLDNYTGIPNEAGEKVNITNDLLRSSHPMNLGIGVLAGLTTNKALNILDPNKKMNRDTRTALSGGLTGAQASLASAALGGEEIASGAILGEGLAGAVGSVVADKTYEKLREAGVGEDPATIASGFTGGASTGGVGGLISAGLGEEALVSAGAGGLIGTSLATGVVAGEESYKAFREKGISKPVASAAGGGIGGAAAGALTATGALASGAALGSEIGAGAAAETFGLSVAVGAGLGALIGEGSYLVGKLF